MPTYSDVRGLDVVTLEDGKKIGSVDDLIIDVEDMRVAWLQIHVGALLLGRSLRVPVDAVRAMDEHTVSIEGTIGTETSEQDPLPIGLASSQDDVIGKYVISDNGLELGTVRDYSFAINGWMLVALIVAVPSGEVFPGTFDLDLQRYEVDITNVAVIAADRQEQAAQNRGG